MLFVHCWEQHHGRDCARWIKYTTLPSDCVVWFVCLLPVSCVPNDASSVSLGCPFLIASSVYTNVYLECFYNVRSTPTQSLRSGVYNVRSTPTQSLRSGVCNVRSTPTQSWQSGVCNAWSTPTQSRRSGVCNVWSTETLVARCFVFATQETAYFFQTK